MASASKTKIQTMFNLVDQWKTSGETKNTFCAEKGMNPHTFSYWVAKRRRSDQPSGGFAAVDITGSEPSERLTITYPNGVVVSCPANLPLISRLIHLA